MKRRTTAHSARTHQRCPAPRHRVTRPRRMGAARTDEQKNNALQRANPSAVPRTETPCDAARRMGAARTDEQKNNSPQRANPSAVPLPKTTSDAARRMGAARTHEQNNNAPPARKPISGAPPQDNVRRSPVGWVWRAHMKRRTTAPSAQTHQQRPNPRHPVSGDGLRAIGFCVRGAAFAPFTHPTRRIPTCPAATPPVPPPATAVKTGTPAPPRSPARSGTCAAPHSRPLPPPPAGSGFPQSL